MYNSNDFIYSKESLELFNKKPPHAIRYGFVIISLFIVSLIVSGYFIQIPHRTKVKMSEYSNNEYVFELKINEIKLNKFDIIINDTSIIKIRDCELILHKDRIYMKFELNNNQVNQLQKLNGIYEITYNTSLTAGYLNYILRGI
jgi:hypothetical protein